MQPEVFSSENIQLFDRPKSVIFLLNGELDRICAFMFSTTPCQCPFPCWEHDISHAHAP